MNEASWDQGVKNLKSGMLQGSDLPMINILYLPKVLTIHMIKLLTKAINMVKWTRCFLQGAEKIKIREIISITCLWYWEHNYERIKGFRILNKWTKLLIECWLTSKRLWNAEKVMITVKDFKLSVTLKNKSSK